MSLYTYAATLKKVIDGDTIDVCIDLGFDIHYACRVRLSGVDAPEIRTSNIEEKKLGLAAKEYVEKWFEANNNRCIINTIKDKKGKYGRILGSVFDIKEEKILNKELLDKGLANKYSSH